MSIMTIEGIVDNGQIRLKSKLRLPNNTRVYVVIPGVEIDETARVYSPRLAHPEQAGNFELEVIEESPNAKL